MSLNLALVVSLADKASKPLRNLGGNVEALGAKADRVGRSISGLGATAVPRLTLPIAAFGGFALRATGQMEQMEVAFESALGKDGAMKLVQDLADFSAKTPFQLTGIGQASRQLLNAGVAVGNLERELLVLGDIAAGAQVPLTDMAAIYQKAMTKGKVQTEELNQLAERGIPIMRALVDLQKERGNDISTQGVYEAAAAGKITFDDLREALGLLTAEGGIFAGQMDKQSQTLFGLFSTLKDNVFNALSEIGEQVDAAFSVKDNMRRLIAWAGDATERFKRLAEERPGLVKLGLRMAAIAAAAGPALIALGVAVSVVGTAVAGLGSVLGAVLSPIGLVVAAIAGAAWLMRDSWADALDWLQGAWSAMLAWFSGPGEDQTIFDWLSAPVTGLFDWIATQWVEALAWITSPDTDIWAWLGSEAAGVFTWLTGQWDRAMAWIESNAPDIGAWLAIAGSGIATWAAGMLEAVVSAIGTADVGGLALALYSSLAAAIAAVDWSRIGRWIGVGLRYGVIAAAGLIAGAARLAVALVKAVFRNLPDILTGIGKLAVAALGGALGLLGGIVAGLFEPVWEAVRGGWIGLMEWIGEKIDEVKLFGQQWVESIWEGIRGAWGEFETWFLQKIDELFGWLPEFVRTHLGIDGGGVPESAPSVPSGLAAAPPVATIFGTGAATDGSAAAAGAPAAARVGGELRIAVEDDRVRVKGLRSDNPEFDIAVETGQVMALS